jgi:hypothetical protein
LNDLRVPPANRLEALRGSRSGQHSIRVNDQEKAQDTHLFPPQDMVDLASFLLTFFIIESQNKSRCFVLWVSSENSIF